MWVWPVAFASAFVLGTLVEYWGHRWMHVWLKRARHIEHHQSGGGQGFCREFWGYARGAWLMFPLGWLHSPAAGVAFASGGSYSSGPSFFDRLFGPPTPPAPIGRRAQQQRRVMTR